MRVTLRSLLTLIALGCVSPMAHAADIYVLTNNNSSFGSATTNFGKINSVTGAYSSIANLASDVWNLAWNPTASNFFTTPFNTANGSSLRTISTAGILFSSLGDLGPQRIYGMSYRTTDNTLYAYEWVNNDTGTINTANGAWSVLNYLSGVNALLPMGGRYSIMNDTLYLAVSSGTSGIGTMGYTATSTYQQIAANAVYANMVLANDGTTMYGIFGNGTAGQQRLYTIDVATGAATAGPLISGTGLGTYFHGAAMVPVPEPSTYVLGGLATGVIGYVARRRKASRKG